MRYVAKTVASSRGVVVLVLLCFGAALLAAAQAPGGGRTATAAPGPAPAVTLPECVAVRNGESLDAGLRPEYERDVYCFEASRGQHATILMLRKSARDNNLDPRLYLLGPDDKLVNDPAADDDRGGQLNALISNVTLPQSGTYRIVGTSFEGESTGSYTLTLRLR